MIAVLVEIKINIFKVFCMDFLLPITSIIQRIHCYVSYNPFIYKEASWRQMAIFCASFHASSYYMSAETASALMFQIFQKYVNRCSIFNKVATLGLQLYFKWIPSKVFFKVFNHNTESEIYSEPCKTSKMERFARIVIGF